MTITNHYKENGLVPRNRKTPTRSNKNYLTYDDISRVVNFITNYAEDHAVYLPGRHPGHRDFTGMMITDDVTIYAILIEYQVEAAQ